MLEYQRDSGAWAKPDSEFATYIEGALELHAGCISNHRERKRWRWRCSGVGGQMKVKAKVGLIRRQQKLKQPAAILLKSRHRGHHTTAKPPPLPAEAER